MFMDATNFNHPLNSWNVSFVIRMGSMFHRAVFFNQPLHCWTVNAKECDVQAMFVGATSFRPDNSWCDDVEMMRNVFEGARVSNNNPF